MSYNKRQKANWNIGKACKGNRKAREKLWEASETRAELLSTPTPHKKKKRKKTPIERIEARIRFYEQCLRRWEHRDDAVWDYFRNSWRAQLKKDQEKLAELKGE